MLVLEITASPLHSQTHKFTPWQMSWQILIQPVLRTFPFLVRRHNVDDTITIHYLSRNLLWNQVFLLFSLHTTCAVGMLMNYSSLNSMTKSQLKFESLRAFFRNHSIIWHLFKAHWTQSSFYWLQLDSGLSSSLPYMPALVKNSNI